MTQLEGTTNRLGNMILGAVLSLGWGGVATADGGVADLTTAHVVTADGVAANASTSGEIISATAIRTAAAASTPTVRTHDFDPRQSSLDSILAVEHQRNRDRDLARGSSLSFDLAEVGDAPEGDGPSGITFTPDGNRILIAHRESHNVLVYDAETRVLLHDISVPGGPVDIAATNDYAITASPFEDTASILDLGTGTLDVTIPVGDQPGSVAISPDGSTAIIANTVDGTLSVIDMESQTETFRIPGLGFIGSVSINFESAAIALSFTELVFAGDSKVVIPDFYNDQIQIVDTDTGTVTTLASVDEPRGVAATPDGTLAVVLHSGTADRVTVIDIASESITKTIAVGTDVFGGAIAVHPDGTKAVVGVQNACRTIDLVTNVVSGNINTASITQIHTTFDGAYAFCVGYNGSLISYATDSLVKNLNTLVSCPLGAVSPTEHRAAMVANTFGEDFLVFDTNGAAGSIEFHGLSGPEIEGDKARQLALSPDGSTIGVVNILSDNVSFFEASALDHMFTIDVGNRPSEVAFTPDGSHAVICNLDSGFSTVVDLVNETATNVPHSTRGSQVEISPDGAYAYVSVVTSDGVWRIDLATKTLDGPKLPTGNMGSVGYYHSQSSGMTLSHDGNTLVVCGSFSDEITIIDTQTWSVLLDLPLGDFPVKAIFNADDSKIFVADRELSRIFVVENLGAGSFSSRAVLVGSYPFDMLLSPDESILYVNNFIDQNVGVVDVASTTQTRTIPLPSNASGLALSGDGATLYIPTGTYSIQLGPGPLIAISVGGEFTSIDTATDAVLESIDTGLPPSMLASRDAPAKLAVSSTFVDGLYFASELDPASVPELGPATGFAVVPNPVRESATIVLRAAAASQVGGTRTISIVDASGRERRRFEVQTTDGEVVWDLRDSAGTRVGSGVYWARDSLSRESARLVVLD